MWVPKPDERISSWLGLRRKEMLGDPVLASNVEMHHISVRQWVLTLSIPLRLLLATQPKLVAPALPVVHPVITRCSLRQAGLPPQQTDTGALSLMQPFGSTAPT